MTAPLVLHAFPSFAVGGAQVRLAVLANRLGAAFRHAIIAMNGVYDCAPRLDSSLDVTYPEIAVRKGAMLANVLAFRAMLRTLRPDLLVTYNWGSIEWAIANRLVNLRHVHVEDGFGPEEQSGQIPRRVLTRRAVLRRCTTVLPSRTLYRIASEVWRLPPTRLRYLPNGIDTVRFRPRDSRDASPGPLVIGTVATLRAEKALGRLLRAVAPLDQTRVVIVGDGPERQKLEALAAELGLGARATFSGALADPAEAYAGFDIFALTSDTEQMPLSVLEAMACGLPVVSTDVGDVRAMLTPDNARFVCPLEDSAITAALRDLSADPVLRRQLGAANRAKAVADYDEAVMVEAWRALFAGDDGVRTSGQGLATASRVP